MPPELPEINQIVANPDGAFHLTYTTTAENDFRDLVNRITIDPAVATIPDTTIYTTDCSGNVWISPNEERIKEIVRETVKELLEQEGYIIGRIPNEISDPPIS